MSRSSDGIAGVGAVQRDLRAHGAGAEHRDRVESRTSPLDPVDEQIDHRVGLRREIVLYAGSDTQFVAISSSAPKKILVAVVALMSLRKAPRCCPSAMVSRISLR